MIKIRDARLNDSKEILKIYGYYVKNTAITFEYDTPPAEEFENRMKEVMLRYPYLVLEEDGKIRGFAYAAPFIERSAYDRSCEVSIYLDKNSRGRGFGRKLYSELENCLRDMGILNLYACIAVPVKDDEYLTANSAEFHAHIGYKKTGEFHKCGYKFGRWYNMIYMEKFIGRHTENPKELINYNNMENNINF